MAYGKVRGVPKPLGHPPARIYQIDTPSGNTSRAAILTIPFDFPAGDEIDPALADQLCKDFNGEIDDGRTYPQEDTLDLAGFSSYFMTYDLVIGFFLTAFQLSTLHDSKTPITASGLRLSSQQLSLLRIGTSTLTTQTPAPSQTSPIHLPNPEDTYAFAYYIKPNYPGRSSHLCNAGFLVPSASRGLGLGKIAGRSFLFYGPACGFRGSVFNLVYASNEASVRIWEKLGFRNVGRIPEAGRLKKEGGGEEYVDAWVVHGDFGKIGVWDE